MKARSSRSLLGMVTDVYSSRGCGCAFESECRSTQGSDATGRELGVGRGEMWERGVALTQTRLRRPCRISLRFGMRCVGVILTTDPGTRGNTNSGRLYLPYSTSAAPPARVRAPVRKSAGRAQLPNASRQARPPTSAERAAPRHSTRAVRLALGGIPIRAPGDSRHKHAAGVTFRTPHTTTHTSQALRPPSRPARLLAARAARAASARALQCPS